MSKKNQGKKIDQGFDVKTYPYTHCRERHQLKPFDGSVDNKSKIGIRVERCVECGTLKTSTISLRQSDLGDYVRSPRYTYPKDYKVKGGLSRHDRGAVRAHNFFDEVKSSSQ